MRGKRLIGMAVPLVPLLFAPPAHSQGDNGGVYWHIDPRVKSCSMVIDPSLTQAQWHKFTEEAGAILTFKSLAPAMTLGKMSFKLAIDYSSTPVDQHDPAWINTFTHPDEHCPLGDEVVIPTVRASMGISDQVDVGGYWTTAPGANYGAVGGELKYAFMQESKKRPAAAARASVSVLTGVPDFNFNIYSVDLIVGKKIAKFTPYIGLRESLATATEATSKVDLDRESLSLTQGFAGIAYSIWGLRVVAEYDVSKVNTFAFAIGAGR